MVSNKLIDRNNKHTVFSEAEPVMQFDTSARTHQFQMTLLSGSFTDAIFKVEHSINNGDSFSLLTENINITEDDDVFFIEDLLTDVMQITLVSATGVTPVFEIYYRGTRNGKN